MDQETFIKAVEAVLRLKKEGELKFVISRVSTNLNIRIGPVATQLMGEGHNINELSQITAMLVPLIFALCNEDEHSIRVQANLLSQQLQLDPELIREQAARFVNEELKRAWFHRTSSMGNILHAVGVTILSRHDSRDGRRLYPFAQVRLEYLDNTLMVQDTSPKSLVFEASVDELVQLRDQLISVIEQIQMMEGGSNGTES